MFLTPYKKLIIILTCLAVLVVFVMATPFLIVQGGQLASREATQMFFLTLEFFGIVYLLNEFNRLRQRMEEDKEVEKHLTNIEGSIKKMSFGSSKVGMKGIVLSGGSATRLFPLTATTSKQLLPVYNKQMIFYPLNTLIKSGIKEILVIISPEHSGQYLNLLGSIFKNYGISLYFEVQKVPRGLADAFVLGEKFIGNDSVAMILGDNIFEDDISGIISNFNSGACIFAKKVSDPERFGVVKFDESGNAINIVEKPKEWISDYAIPGIYVFDNDVVEIAKNIKPSDRGEIEIVDIHNHYLQNKKLKVEIMNGEWLDAGTFDSLLEAGSIVKNKGISKNFHPIVEQAIEDFNQEMKNQTKNVLSAHNLSLKK